MSKYVYSLIDARAVASEKDCRTVVRTLRDAMSDRLGGAPAGYDWEFWPKGTFFGNEPLESDCVGIYAFRAA